MTIITVIMMRVTTMEIIMTAATKMEETVYSPHN
jgi:hypothetical protein